MLDETQLKAVAECTDISKRIVSVTGQAGTGKTTIIKETYNALKEKGVSVVLCAPTGKAAKRITEATGIEAVTIHRLLEYPKPAERDPATGKVLLASEPKRDKNFPLDFTVVICDEYAMTNHEVHRNLIDALCRGGCLRMFGDVNQLQPIETQQCLQDKRSPFMEALERFTTITLEHIYRQDEGSSIITNANYIKQGRMPLRTDDFELIVSDIPVSAVKKFISANPEYFTLSHQFIVPTRKTWVGTNKLNNIIQSMKGLNHNRKLFEPERHTWAEDMGTIFMEEDKVLVTQNLYELEVFNGETGIIKSIDENHNVEIDFGDKVVIFPESIERTNKYGKTYYYCPHKDLDLAYAITTHKAQGSEYTGICYVMNKTSFFLQNRKNFYTAVTRARKKVTIISDQRSLQTSLSKVTDYEKSQQNKTKVSGSVITYRK